MKLYYKLKIIMIIIVAVYAGTGVLFAQDNAYIYQTPELAEIFSSIQSPEQLSSWLSKNFHYEMKFPDYPQTIDKILESRVGDCDDLATLSSLILSTLNIDNKVIIITFKGISIKHAICIFRNKYGSYDFISNKELIRTKQTTIKLAIASVYQDCTSYEDVKL